MPGSDFGVPASASAGARTRASAGHAALARSAALQLLQTSGKPVVSMRQIVWAGLPKPVARIVKVWDQAADRGLSIAIELVRLDR